MKNYKLNIDREKLSPEEIAEGKNFEAVLAQFQKSKMPFYKNKWFIGGLSAIAVAAILVILAVQYFNKPSEDQLTQDRYNTKLINPPMEGIDVPYTKYQVSAEKGGIFSFASGTKIIVPKDAFVDQDGEIISGEVDLNYREFRDQVDLFFAGVPMDYDSNGVNYQFESAGMMELTATQNGTDVFLNPEKEINIQMAALSDGQEYNIYYLDTNKGTWTYAGRDRVMPDDADQFFTADLEDGQTEGIYEDQSYIRDPAISGPVDKVVVEPDLPVKPRLADKEKYRFRIDFLPGQFPELSVYEGVLFEVSDNNENYDPNTHKIEWNFVEVDKTDHDNEYKVTFMNSSQKVEIFANPVFEEGDYDKAMTLYEEKYKEYKKGIEERKKREEEARIEAEEEKKRLAAERKKWENATQAKESFDIVRREFAINNLGYWNIDKLENNNFRQLAVSFRGQDKKEVELYQVCIVDLNRNTYFPYYKSRDKFVIRFNQEAPVYLWTITLDNKLAIVRQDEFKDVPAQAKEYTFALEIVEKDFQNIREIKEFLGVGV